MLTTLDRRLFIIKEMGFLKKLFGSSDKNEEPKTVEVGTEDGVDNQNKDLKVIENQADTLKFDAIRASRIHEYDFALNAFEKSLELRPQFETRYYYMETLFAANHRVEGLRQLDLLIEEEPAHIPSLYKRCNTGLEDGKFEEVLNDADKALEIVRESDAKEEPEKEDADQLENQPVLEDISFYEFSRCKAKALEGLGRVEEAVNVINSLIEDYPKAGELYLLKGRIEIESRHFEDAENSLSKASELMPDEEYVPIMKARLAFACEKLEESLELYQSVLELDPFSIDAHLGIAGVYKKQGQADEAIKFLEEAMDEENPNRDFLKMLISLYQDTGNEERRKKLEEKLDSLEEEKDAKANFDNLYSGGLY